MANPPAPAPRPLPPPGLQPHRLYSGVELAAPMPEAEYNAADWNNRKQVVAGGVPVSASSFSRWHFLTAQELAQSHYGVSLVVCFDYVYWRMYGRATRAPLAFGKVGAGGLLNALPGLGYRELKQFSGPGTQMSKVYYPKMIAGDVILLGQAHTAIVEAAGKVSHLLQAAWGSAVSKATSDQGKPIPISMVKALENRVETKVQLDLFLPNVRYAQLWHQFLDMCPKTLPYPFQVWRKFPPAVQRTVKAIHVTDNYNPIARDKSPRTQGFGDSKKDQTWVPFRVVTNTLPKPPSSVLNAKIVMEVKPVGGPYADDELVLFDANRRNSHRWRLYPAAKPPVGQWRTISIDVTSNKEVMDAILSGWLDGGVGAETAVKSVDLVYTE